MEQQARASDRAVVAAEIATFMLRAPREQFVDPVLKALQALQVRQARIAKILGIAKPSVAQMFSGQRALAEKHRRRLLMVLRDASALMRAELDKAEAGTILYQGRPFPASVITQMRAACDRAEKILRQSEKAES